ncbi:MAG TPA: mechanosensitive ion channel, partial [Chitinophagales bacterium]|nr:mechanosensitive ion channel [Chitinophagales bacterium]
VLYLLDVNITTIIAGISIGGLAFALAAQDTVKNFIGSIMLFLDRPFNIGDTIKCEQFEGSVLEVGIRSTRIRTLNDSIISIPNGRLADLTIDNKGYRTFKKYKKEFAVSADTPLYVIELYIQSLKDLLAVFPNIKPFSVDIFLADITEAGRMVSIAFTYTIFSNRDEHTQREAILLEILRLSEIMNISLFETSATADNKTVNQKVFLTQDEYQKKISVLVADLKSKQSEPPTGS